MKVLIELRPGEGGTDAKLLTEAQRAIYLRYAEKQGLRIELGNLEHL